MAFSNLDRFVAAQDAAGTYARAVSELRAGHKTSHWMWFVFPQLAGLGSSPMTQQYAIESVGEAQRYLAHEILGPRLVECAGIVAGTDAGSAEEILGSIDAMKLRSSMTLFVLAATDEPGADPALFQAVLDRWYAGRNDVATLQMLGRGQPE